MAKTANINLRIDPDVKHRAEELFNSFGISVTDALNIFIHTSLMEGGFPFLIKQPKYNRETELAMQEANDIASGKIQAKSYRNLSEILEELDAETED